MEEVEPCFISTQEMDDERVQMGWNSGSAMVEIKAYMGDAEKKQAMRLANDSEVVIIGSAPDAYIIPRLKAGKLTFKYSERFYKQGLPLKKFPHAIVGAWLHHGRFQKYPLYMLCASAFTAGDAAVFHNYIGRTYKWGYFPEEKHYNVDAFMEKKQGLKHPCASILWAGRLIGLKHPDASIRLAETLKQQGYSFKLSIIGNGSMEQELHRMISEKKLEDCVEMLGAMSPEKVREHMEKADIFLFTSDFNEGWGAVLNESMNSGCAVVASHAIGSVPFLIRNGENGLIYENGNEMDLQQQVIRLLENPSLRVELGRNAYQTMAQMWNAENAAKRFMKLAGTLLEGKNPENLFDDGPCSKAEILKNGWYTKAE